MKCCFSVKLFFSKFSLPAAFFSTSDEKSFVTISRQDVKLKLGCIRGEPNFFLQPRHKNIFPIRSKRFRKIGKCKLQKQMSGEEVFLHFYSTHKKQLIYNGQGSLGRVHEPVKNRPWSPFSSATLGTRNLANATFFISDAPSEIFCPVEKDWSHQ